MPTRTPTLASAPEGSMAGTVRKVGGGGGQGRAGRGWEGRVRRADRAERAPPTLYCCSNGSCVAQLPCVGPAWLPLPQVLLVQLVVLLCGPLVTTWFSSEPRLMPASWSSAPGPHTPLWASCCPRLSREQRPQWLYLEVSSVLTVALRAGPCHPSASATPAGGRGCFQREAFFVLVLCTCGQGPSSSTKASKMGHGVVAALGEVAGTWACSL